MKLLRVLFIALGLILGSIGFASIFLGAFGGSSSFMIYGLFEMVLGIFLAMKGTE